MKRIVLLVSLVWIAAASATSQSVEWVRHENATRPTWRNGYAVAHDPIRNRTVLFGGTRYPDSFDDTWEWDGVTWRRIHPVNRPAARHRHAMVWDAVRQRVILFGGVSWHSIFADAWSWDGVDWTPIRMTGGPPARYSFAMSFDSRRGCVVVHGGRDHATLLDDLWEWDGVRWRERKPASRPSRRFDHAVAFDSVRGRVVLFGGYSPTVTPLADTWEWDGATWTPRVPRTSPSARRGHRMAFDAATGRVVLFGSMQTRTTAKLVDTWEWDGNDWTQRVLQQNPPPDAVGIFHDPIGQRMLLFTGAGHNYFADVVWEWRLGRWRAVTLAGNPPRRWGATCVYDSQRRRIVMFGGQSAARLVELNDLWEWDGADNWVQRTPPISPPARIYHAMVEDAARGRLVLFGGTGSAGAFGDTWEWDGAVWTPASSMGPSPRAGHAMAFDPVRRRTVLFGGNEATGVVDDTWDWDGTRWSRHSVGRRPSPRSGAAMAFDPVSACLMLFGGSQGTACVVPPAGDTWSWDGRGWRTSKRVGARPTPRYGAAMVHDTTRQRVVLFGGQVPAPMFPRCFATRFIDTWTRQGRTWIPVRPLPLRTGEYPSVVSLVHDDARGRTVLFDQDSGTAFHRRAADIVPSTHAVSIATGGTVSVRLRAAPMHGGRAFALLGCIDRGVLRAIPLGNGVMLPLSVDPYFVLTANAPATVFGNGRGTLSKDGKATATIRVPAGLPAAMIGTRFYHAYVVTGSRVFYASAAVPLRLAP